MQVVVQKNEVKPYLSFAMFLEQESNGQPDAPICGRRETVVSFCSFSAESADKMNRKFTRAE
jgi:hypothetical protein